MHRERLGSFGGGGDFLFVFSLPLALAYRVLLFLIPYVYWFLAFFIFSFHLCPGFWQGRVFVCVFTSHPGVGRRVSFFFIHTLFFTLLPGLCCLYYPLRGSFEVVALKSRGMFG